MEGINPSSGAPQQAPQRAELSSAGGPHKGGAGQSVTHAAAGSASSTSLVAQSSTTVTFVNQQVDTMLANIGQGMQDQQTLRLIIALMILQQLMGDEQGGGNNNAAQLLGQMGGNGNGNGTGSSASLASLSSQTTMMQVHQEQTLAYNHQSVQGAAVSHYANGAAGEQEGQARHTGTDVTA
ncbi:MAG: hypothetical protein ACODAQ_06725 [Phycisphaeraceae bacterium]